MGVERTRTTAQATAEGLRIFVAGVPWHITEETVKRDFEECGIVEDCFLLRDQEGNSRGKAFITFRDAEAVKAAFAYDNTEYAGRTIFVKIAEAKRGKLSDEKSENPLPQNQKQTKDFPMEKPKGCTSICLKGIGDATEEDIRKLLKGCSLQSVRIVYDRATGLSRGIAFVDFPNSEEVDKAMRQNGKNIRDQAVDMRYETPKERPRPEGCFTVAVKKLRPEVSEKDLRKLFKGLQSIQDVRLICDKQQLCTGLAFVEFADAADVEAAVRRDGMAVQGNTVFICYETKQKKIRSPMLTASQTTKMQLEPALNQESKKRNGKQKDNDKVASDRDEGNAPMDLQLEPALKQKKGKKKKQKNSDKKISDNAKGDATTTTDVVVPKKRKRRVPQLSEGDDEGELPAQTVAEEKMTGESEGVESSEMQKSATKAKKKRRKAKL